MPTSQENSATSPSASTSPLDSMLGTAIIFAAIFEREAQRKLDGSANQMLQASVQLRACLDRIDEIQQGELWQNP